MPIVATDLVKYGSASRPSDDTATTGGAIDQTDRPDITQLTANSVIAVVSSASDSRAVTVQGRNAAGAIISENITLNSTTEVVGVSVFERILTISVPSANANTVTIRQGAGGATRAIILPNETSRTSLFRQSASEAGTAIRYEKTFWRNSHATLTLNSAQVRLTVDPDSRIRIGLATTINDTGSVTNRKTAPAGVTFVDDNVFQSVPGGVLTAGDRIGVWWEQSLPPSDAAHRTSATDELSGTSV